MDLPVRRCAGAEAARNRLGIGSELALIIRER